MPVQDVISKASKVLVIGYSPTGGGHTGRIFSIIEQAIEDGHVNKEDVLIFHCPPKWENTDRPELNRITTILEKNGIHVVFTLADKSVYGYLKKDGSSDDGKILERFASYPQRSKNQHADIIACAVLWSSHTSDLLPTQFIYSEGMDTLVISSKHLMQSLVRALDNKTDKLYVITDMDPYLQKAAIAAGVSPRHCLDQQNHAILLDNADLSSSSYALLAKVLSASGGKISHIELGDKNTLFAIENLLNDLGISVKTGKATAKHLVIDVLYCYGAKINLKEKYSQTKAGVMWPEGLQPQDVQQIIYIYAHAHTPEIGELIRKKIESKDSCYVDKLFLFCSQGAILEKNYNAMHLAYIAEASGITTAGAGTTGEFAYLHTRARWRSHLLILPIHGHNEQTANAKFIANKCKDNVLYASEIDILFQINELVKIAPLKPGRDEYMDTFINAITNKNTYSRQASEILFENLEHTQSLRLNAMARMMCESQAFKINRRYIKAVFQVLGQVAGEPVTFPIKIKITGENPSEEFKNIHEIVAFFQKDDALMKIAGNHQADVKIPELILRDQVITFFQKCQNFNPLDKLKEIEVIKDAFGSQMTTGF